MSMVSRSINGSRLVRDLGGVSTCLVPQSRLPGQPGSLGVQLSGGRMNPHLCTTMGGQLSDCHSGCHQPPASMFDAIPTDFPALHLGTPSNLPDVSESCAVRCGILLQRSACLGRKLPVAKGPYHMSFGVCKTSEVQRYITRQRYEVTCAPIDSTGTYSQGGGHARGSTRADPPPTEALNISWDPF